MRQFLTFVQKECRHIFRDRWTTLILLGLPVVMLVLFGFAISTEVRNTRFVACAPTQDQATRAIIERLDASPYFSFEGLLPAGTQPDQVFRQGRASLVLVFEPDFGARLWKGGPAQVQLVADASDPNTAKTFVQYASSIILAWQADQAAAAQVPLRVQPEIKLLYNPGMKGAFNFVPGVMGMILMLICAMMTSISIAREKELGTMELLLVSPLHPLKIILAKTVPYFAISVVDLAIILLLSVHVLEVPIAGSLAALVVLSLLFIFLALSLGLLISSVVRTQLVALLISGVAMVMPVIMLSEMMFPVDSMPLVLQGLAQVVPAKWYIAAVKKVMIKGLGFAAIVQELAVLGGMTVAFLALALKNHKARLE